MQNKCKKFRLWSILLLVMLMAAGFTCHSTSRDVQAATKNGFRTVKGKTYYYKNGKKVKGWIYSVHVGSWGGMTTRILTCLVSLLGTIFAITGYYFWIKKQFRKLR